MSPRRRLEPGFEPYFPVTPPRTPWRRAIPGAAVLSALIVAAAIAVCAVNLHAHDIHRHAAIRDAAALSYVRSFMIQFSSPDPFHANDYADRVLAQATGDFAQQYRQNQNVILVQVARSEPTSGTVLDAGVSSWNDDGSVDVLVTTKFTSKSADGTVQLDRTNRWVVTAKQEGQSWKISRLTPMI